MSKKAEPEKLVPLSAVFISIGTILLLAVCVVWALVPAWMPTPLYNLVGVYLPETAVSQAFPISTPVPNNPQPTSATNLGGQNLLPETPLDMPPTPTYPAHFVSALDAIPPTPIPGQPLHLSIPAIQLNADITDVGLVPVQVDGATYFQWQVPSEHKVGWHDTSARLGQPGNTVLNGHHNIYGEVFRHLVDLKVGDQIIISDSTQSHTYTVTETKILEERDQPLEVRLENAAWINPTTDERVTLVTCWPYTDNSHRVIVVAKPTTP